MLHISIGEMEIEKKKGQFNLNVWCFKTNYIWGVIWNRKANIIRMFCFNYRILQQNLAKIIIENTLRSYKIFHLINNYMGLKDLREK